MGDANKYPHWKDALFGNGHVANLRCAGKYLFWHLLYGVLAVIGLVLVGSHYVLTGVADRVPSKHIGNLFSWFAGGVDRTADVLHNRRLKKWIGNTVLVLLGLSALVVLGWGISFMIQHPWMALESVVLVLGIISLMFAAAYIEDRWEPGARTKYGLKIAVARVASALTSSARIAGSKAKETPGVRRVYGNCPVSMNIEPKWFGKITEYFD